MPRCHSTTAWPSTSMPRRPARPVSWVYSPGVMSACCSPFHLTSFSSTTERAGMLMPSARVSVAKTALTRPRTNSSSTTSLKVGSMPGVVGGDAPLQAFEPLVVAEDVEVLVGDGGGALLDDLADLRARLVVVEPQARVQALLDGGLAAGPAEDEGDGGQQPLGVEPLDDLGPARRPDPAALAPLALAVGLAHHLAAPPVARVVRALVLHPGQPDEVGVDLAAAAPRPPWSVSSSKRSYIRRPASTCCHSGTGRCSETITSVSPRTVSSQSPNSSALDTVADRETRVTDSGRWMITSSQTAPRKRSER